MSVARPRLLRIAHVVALAVPLSGCIPTLLGESLPEGWRRIEGLPVPEETGPFRIDSVYAFPNPAYGSVIGFVTRDGLPQSPPFELFIYAMQGRTLDEEVLLARAALRQTAQELGDVHGGALAPTTELVSRFAPYPVYETTLDIMHKEGPLRSHVYVTRVMDKFLAARVTYHASTPSMVDRAMNRHVMRLVDDIAVQAAR